MNVLDLVEVWAEEHNLQIKWGYDSEDSIYQYHFHVTGIRGNEQNLIDELDYVLDRIGYVIDMAYDYAGGVYVEIARR